MCAKRVVAHGLCVGSEVVDLGGAFFSCRPGGGEVFARVFDEIFDASLVEQACPLGINGFAELLADEESGEFVNMLEGMV